MAAYNYMMTSCLNLSQSFGSPAESNRSDIVIFAKVSFEELLEDAYVFAWMTAISGRSAGHQAERVFVLGTVLDGDPAEQLAGVILQVMRAPSNIATRKTFSRPLDRQSRFCTSRFTSDELFSGLLHGCKPKLPNPDGLLTVQSIQLRRLQYEDINLSTIKITGIAGNWSCDCNMDELAVEATTPTIQQPPATPAQAKPKAKPSEIWLHTCLCRWWAKLQLNNGSNM